MVEPSSARDHLASKISSLSDLEVAELLEYIKIMESMRDQLASPGLFEDEVASLLASGAGARAAEMAASLGRARRRSVRGSFTSAPTTSYLA